MRVSVNIHDAPLAGAMLVLLFCHLAEATSAQVVGSVSIQVIPVIPKLAYDVHMHINNGILKIPDHNQDA